jgi:adenine deaminase
MSASTKHDPNSILKRIQAARGKIECDLVLKNAIYLDVFTCAWRTGDISIFDGTIIGVEPGLKAKRTVDVKGRTIVPGFVDAHVHIESSLLVPSHFQTAVLSRGTTTAICDPHELANVKGVPGIQYFLGSAAQMEMDLWVMLSSSVPATLLETNGGGVIDSSELAALSKHPNALGLAEMMNVPGVLEGEHDILKKLSHFAGKPIDGHCPLLRGQALSAYAVSGVSTCHETSELEEAIEKVSKGLMVWIREGSVAKDLHALLPLLTLATSGSVGFCTDDRNPLDILNEGHVDYLVREAIKKGVPTEVAFRSASLTPCRHYGLGRVGAIAPGYQADLILLADTKSVAIEKVIKSGRFVDEIELRASSASYKENTIRAVMPQPADLEGPTGQVHVIEIEEKKIITKRSVKSHNAPGVAKVSVLERYGKKSKPANAYVSGFGEKLRGAIASSVAHDSHNLIVIGDRTDDMKAALASLIETGGGFSVVQDGKVLARLPLPFGGLMSNDDARTVHASLVELKKATRAIGCTLNEPFLQMGFLSLPVIPSLKITDKGLVDVNQSKIIDVRSS